MCAHAGPIVSHLVGILDYWNCITWILQILTSCIFIVNCVAMCQAFHAFCTFGILNTTSVHISVVYILHPKYLWNVICLVGYLKAHPLSCLAWWDWLLTGWPPEASSFTFLCVST
jgi:hypothetical protein